MHIFSDWEHEKVLTAMRPIVYSHQSMLYSNYFMACLDECACVSPEPLLFFLTSATAQF